MSATNGKPPKIDQLSVEELREQTKTLRARARYRRAQLESQVLEGYFYGDYSPFGGSDSFERLHNRDGADRWVPLSVPSDRRGGSNWPMWRTEQELAELRQQSRLRANYNAYCKGLRRNMVAYTIGKGFSYKAGPKDQEQADERVDGLVRHAQRFIDDFLTRNHFNCGADPLAEEAMVSPSREQEAFLRTLDDGEAYVRCFFRDDDEHKGKTDVRFVDPELLRNPAGATYQQGWSYGARHAVEPYEDLERVVEYHVVYHDPTISNEQQQAERDGELVSAAAMVHIKRPGVSAQTKRGTPEWVWDVGEALDRASKLQRNMSISAAVRAGTAEIWQHHYGTQSQINSLASTNATYQRNDPVSGQTQQVERVIPGRVRRIPQGQELVPLPASSGVAEHIQAAQGDLRQASAAFSAPEYMTGDASNNNLASSQEAGAPFVRCGELEQEHYKTAYLVCVWKAVRWAVKCGVLPAEVLTLITIQVEAPTIHKNDELERAQVAQIHLQNKTVDPQTVIMQNGHDPKQVMSNWQEWDEQMGPSDQGGMGGDQGGLAGLFGQDQGQQDAAAPDGQPPAPGQQAGLNESLERLLAEHGMTGIVTDKRGHKHRYVDGKPVPLGQQKPSETHGKTAEPAKPAGAKNELHDEGPRFAKPAAVRGEMTQARRIGKGKDAQIILADGKPAPAHIKPSMVPPDWADVRVSTDPHADVLVMARDNKGRAKTVYADSYHMQTAAVKFARTSEAMQKMPEMLKEMQHDRHDPKKREEAECAWLMAEQATRPGSDSDTGAKVKAYGATTLLAEHVEQGEDGTVRLHFIGKEGVEHNHVIRNPDLAAMLLERKQTADQRGGKLFATDENRVRVYVGQLDGGGFLSKDMRTVRANIIGQETMKSMSAPTTEKEYKAAVKRVAEAASHVLGNRPAQALESYLNPTLFAAWRANLQQKEAA